jgi:hypothetical protein
MAKNCFVENEAGGYVRLVNTTGAEVVAGEFCILGGVSGVAQETIANGAVGNFMVGAGAKISTDSLTTSEDTFGTGNQDVYFETTGKTFSDTKTIGYYKVGQLAEVKASGKIVFLKDYKAELVPTFAALADVDVAGVTNNDTLKYVSSTGKWTDVAVAD